MASDPHIALFFTTFPKTSETFLQRDVAALQAKGLKLKLYSLWGGGGEFRGLPVQTFPKWRLIPVFLWIIPMNCVRRPRLMRDLFEGVIRRPAPSWLNFWENMLGAGFAGSFAQQLSKDPPALVHGAWSGAPTTAAWVLWRMFGWRYSAGAHAYDIYEHGGDWWLLEKLQHARFIQASTEMARNELIARGVPPEKIVCIRRGLETFPLLKAVRADRSVLRLVCIARLVAKKGFEHQLKIYAALRAAGVAFEARIVGEGPLRTSLEAMAAKLGVADCVHFLGQLPQPSVWTQLEWADVLLHTGIVAPSGDRDGLPNVIPEAMAAGTLVVTSPVAATTEAITADSSGLVAAVEQPAEWVAALTRLRDDDALAARLQRGARAWVEQHYDAHRNTAQLVACFQGAMLAGESKSAGI